VGYEVRHCSLLYNSWWLEFGTNGVWISFGNSGNSGEVEYNCISSE